MPKTEVPRKLTVKGRTIVPLLHQMASEEETEGRHLDPGVVAAPRKGLPGP